MSAHKNFSPHVIPGLQYRDAPAAIDWLCDVFGFERHLVVPDDKGGIAHAQLTLGNGMIMLGSDRDTEFSRYIQQPDGINGAETQSAYIVVSDADAVYTKAKSEGAEILIEIHNPDYGGRGFTCRDPQGHIWSIGTYNPWAAHNN